MAAILRLTATILAGLAAFGWMAQAQNPQNPLTPEQLETIDRYVPAEMARERIPGAEVGIYRDGQALLAKGYGMASLEFQAPVSPTTLMQSGSTGKQFAATAVMMLVEQGKIGLEDSIRTYFLDAPESWQKIKVKNLLSHTSGLAEYESGERTEPGAEFYLRLDFTEDELLHKIEKLPIEFQPGDKWDYRNTNYVLLGIMIHKVTGQFYGDYLHDKIFSPLGMVSTRIISDRDVIPNRSAGYEMEGGKLKNQAFVSPTFNQTADGTMYYNVVDLEKWDRALYGTSLIGRASLEKMWTPFVLNDGKANSAGYGFGWMVADVNGHRLIEHSGAWQGFTSMISRYVDDKLTVVVLTNLDAGHSRPRNIERVVAGLVEPALMPKLTEPIADTDPAIAAKLQELLGKTVGRPLKVPEVEAYFAPEAGYHLDESDSDDLQASLPADWLGQPMVLVRREKQDGQTRSLFRVGKPGDTRNVWVRTDASGKFWPLRVTADPDNR
jgi:CubicO group peptidase (beta-lactamase class C family)